MQSPVSETSLPEHTRVTIAMDTLVSVQVQSAQPAETVAVAIQRALNWFAEVERRCSRFDPDSELMRLCSSHGQAVTVSPLLFEAVALALEVARITRGAFDPTVGATQQARGFSENYITGRRLVRPATPAGYRDLRLHRGRRTITLLRPLLLDLGAVAKGFAIDLAARELAAFERFAVDAGGDLFVGGAVNAASAWQVGVREPRGDGLLGTVTARNRGVCTSGDYERRAGPEGENHLLDPHTGRSPRALISVTVVAPTAVIADALATAAFVLGSDAGLRLLEEQGVAGVIVSSDGAVKVTATAQGELSWSAFPR